MSPEELFFKLTRLQRTLIVAAICVLALVGWYFFAISDIRESIARYEVQISKLKMQIASEQRIFQEGPKLKARIMKLKTRLQAMVASLP